MFKKYFIIFIISMIPLLELRGAIPYAVAYRLPLLTSYIVAIIGNMLPVPFIYLFARRILEWGKNINFKPISKLCYFCITKGEKARDKLLSKSKDGIYIALLFFVGIPLPGTGAWTGTLAASFLDLDFKKSVLAIMCGVVLAGIIMGLVSSGIFGTINFIK